MMFAMILPSVLPKFLSARRSLAETGAIAAEKMLARPEIGAPLVGPATALPLAIDAELDVSRAVCT